jgi:hypothetical protein
MTDIEELRAIADRVPQEKHLLIGFLLVDEGRKTVRYQFALTLLWVGKSSRIRSTQTLRNSTTPRHMWFSFPFHNLPGQPSRSFPRLKE